MFMPPSVSLWVPLCCFSLSRCLWVSPVFPSVSLFTAPSLSLTLKLSGLSEVSVHAGPWMPDWELRLYSEGSSQLWEAETKFKQGTGITDLHFRENWGSGKRLEQWPAKGGRWHGEGTRVSQGHSHQNPRLGGEKQYQGFSGSQSPRRGVRFPLFRSSSLTAHSDVTFSSLVRGVRASFQWQEVPFSSLPPGWTTQLQNPQTPSPHHWPFPSKLLLFTASKGGDANDSRKEGFKHAFKSQKINGSERQMDRDGRNVVSRDWEIGRQKEEEMRVVGQRQYNRKGSWGGESREGKMETDKEVGRETGTLRDRWRGTVVQWLGFHTFNCQGQGFNPWSGS